VWYICLTLSRDCHWLRATPSNSIADEISRDWIYTKGQPYKG